MGIPSGPRLWHESWLRAQQSVSVLQGSPVAKQLRGGASGSTAAVWGYLYGAPSHRQRLCRQGSRQAGRMKGLLAHSVQMGPITVSRQLRGLLPSVWQHGFAAPTTHSLFGNVQLRQAARAHTPLFPPAPSTRAGRALQHAAASQAALTSAPDRRKGHQAPSGCCKCRPVWCSNP